MAAKEFLVILASPDGMRSEGAPGESYMYVVEPESGKVSLAWKETVAAPR